MRSTIGLVKQHYAFTTDKTVHVSAAWASAENLLSSFTTSGHAEQAKSEPSQSTPYNGRVLNILLCLFILFIELEGARVLRQ